jgi:signal peptidase I
MLKTSITGTPGQSPQHRWRGRVDLVVLLLAVSLASVAAADPMRTFRVVATNMEPTALLGEAVLVDTEYYRTKEPARGDVVVLWVPRNKTEHLDRIIGLPGDRVQMRVGQLLVNDREVPRRKIEDYVYHFVPNGPGEVLTQYVETLPPGATGEGRAHRIIKRGDDGFLDNTKIFEVPPGQYFVLGDNRDNAVDSRTDVGFVPRTDIIGRAISHAGSDIE